MGMADYRYLETEGILGIMQCQEGRGTRAVYADKVQVGFAATHRCGLVDWLMKVAQELQVQPETLHLALDLMDRFFSVVPVQTGQEPLAAAACLWISSKYEEVYPASAAEICGLSAISYSSSELVRMEASILKALDFSIAQPTAWTFYGTLMHSVDPQQADQQLWYLAQYLLELSLLDPCLVTVRPSARAAASIYLARKMLHYPQVWSATLIRCSRYQAEDVHLLAARLAYAHMCISGDGIYTASRTYFSDHSKHCVSTLPSCYELAACHMEHAWLGQYRQHMPWAAAQPPLQHKPAWLTAHIPWGSIGAVPGPVTAAFNPFSAQSLVSPAYNPFSAHALMPHFADSMAAGATATPAFASPKAAHPACASAVLPDSSVCYCHWCLHYGQCRCWERAASTPQHVLSSMSYQHQWQQQAAPSYGWTWQLLVA